jgi:hypothetical protein
MRTSTKLSRDRVVGLLRGVNNIGSTKRIAMADLRALVERLGFRDVRTLLNSGNIVFSVPSDRRGDVAGRIEKALGSRFGIHSRVTVISGDEVAAVSKDERKKRTWKIVEKQQNHKPSGSVSFKVGLPSAWSRRARASVLVANVSAPAARAQAVRRRGLWSMGYLCGG